jgi:hypothetical protein
MPTPTLTLHIIDHRYFGWQCSAYDCNIPITDMNDYCQSREKSMYVMFLKFRGATMYSCFYITVGKLDLSIRLGQ